MCSTCGSVTRPVDVVEHVELGPLYLGALKYPMGAGHHVAFLALAVGAWFFSHVPVAGPAFAMAVVITWLLSVVPHTARGNDTLPEPTDFVHFTDYIVPTLRAFAACAAGFAPFVLTASYAGPLPWAVRAPLLAITGAAALAWLPGAMAWASIAGRVTDALDPRPVLAIVTRAPSDYARTVATVWALGVAHVFLVLAAAAMERALCFFPIVPGIAYWAAGIFMPAVMARVVGLLLRARRFEIGVDV